MVYRCSPRGTDELAAALNSMDLGNEVVANVYPATQHRGVVCLSGPRLSQSISDTDPGELGSPRYVLSSAAIDEDDAAASNTARAVNDFVCRSFEILREHPVNQKRLRNNELPATGIITRGAGMYREMHTLLNQLKMKVAVVAGERTVLGLAKLFKYTPISDPGFTSLPDTNLKAKVHAVLTALESNDLVYLHVKGTDTCSHDMDPQGKISMLEKIDAAIAPLAGSDRVIGVAADHSTDSILGRHCGDPVPVASTNTVRPTAASCSESSPFSICRSGAPAAMNRPGAGLLQADRASPDPVGAAPPPR